MPAQAGRQNAAWALMSSEWIDAEQARDMGLVWRVCTPDELMDTAREHAEILASKPISSLVAVKQAMTEPLRAAVEDARERENAYFREMLGAPANKEALAAFAEGRPADFTKLESRD